MKDNDYNMEILKNLHKKNPMQYYTLIKMHLSFITNISLDQVKRESETFTIINGIIASLSYEGFTGEKGSQPSAFNSRCDGSFDNSKASSGRWNLSPLFKKMLKGNQSHTNTQNNAISSNTMENIFALMRFLKKNENITQEGLFRKTGSVTRQSELKAAIHSRSKYEIESGLYSAHDCASVLKSFLADLPDPILQESQYHVHCRIVEMCQKNSSSEQQAVSHYHQVKALSLVFLLLPLENYTLLRELLLLLYEVTLHEAKNKMSSLNLGTMFAPHILCPRKMSANELQFQSGSLSTTVAFIIENAQKLFEIPSELILDVKEYFRVEEAMQRQMSKKSLENAPANTLFTFVDRELTAEANSEDVTKVALAELYAYVQSLPDSAKKSKLISKFNEASGQGTPKCSQSFLQKTDQKAKSFGNSIKRHIFFSRSVKKSKTKNPFNKVLNISRSNSDDVLSTSSVYCSPEIGSEKSPKTKAKSMDNLLSPKFSHNNDESSTHSAWKKQKKKLLALTPSLPESLTSCSAFVSSTPILRNSRRNASQNQGSLQEDDQSSKKDGDLNSPEYSVSSVTPVQKLFENEDGSKSPVSPLSNNDNEPIVRISPISKALRRSSSQQKVMMTPRSRRPIIISSTSNLSSMPIPENSVNSSRDVCSKISSALVETNGGSVVKLGDKAPSPQDGSLTINNATYEEASGERDSPFLNSKDTSGGMFSTKRLLGLYNYLTTSSLLKIATHLSSNSSCGQEVFSPNCSNCHETSHNETLTSVFKDYLLNRSILTDNPIDLSSEELLSDSKREDSANDNYLNASDSSSHLKDLNIINPCLSKSLLFCLDGNDPLHMSSTPKRLSFSSDGSPYCSSTKRSRTSERIQEIDEPGDLTEPPYRTIDLRRVKDDSTENMYEGGGLQKKARSPANNLHSCSPSGRSSSFLKNRNGTPLPNRERNTKSALSSAKNVLFETRL